MKRKVLITSLIFSIFSFIKAQEVEQPEKEKTKFGISVGAVRVKYFFEINDDKVEDLSLGDDGLSIGALVDISLIRELSIQAGINYMNFDGSDGHGVIFPIVLKYYGKKSRLFNLQLGLMGGFGMDNDVSGDDFQSFNISATGGLGIEFTEHFFFEGRYSLQLNNYYAGDLDISSKSSLITLALGYKFDIN